MTRFIFSTIGAIFSLVTLGLRDGRPLGWGGVLRLWAATCPTTSQLSQYRPPTISRIYSTEGRIVDEFAEERAHLMRPPRAFPTS